ncbi:hypothetical protein DL766_000215 [Monosporascus sp. MC13-8B]|uniref:MAPEG family protein n=1 Tax=Monosporascus cannonballus TaxID=155416 RepID=A0ABY0H1Q0_9PEZI|nr:hypothetical protein DL762_006525 [Monosporascus cannonballus]RYO83767.1 hypothetical protein DL763_007730 [Monosporascus cannonballus]RYP39773.1 hypothetical protein DL766_000215 [Monosporascus sp. MC13-8B]
MTSRIGLATPVLPPLLPVTGTFALPFALLSSLLSLRVVQCRRADKHPLGDNSAKDAQSQKTNKLFRASRCHANFIENVPLAFIFAAAAELNGGSRRALAGALGSLFVLRVLHSEFGLLQEGGMGFGRGVGHSGTLGIELGLAGYAAYLAKGYWGF